MLKNPHELHTDKYFHAIATYEKTKHTTEAGNKKGVVYTHQNIAREMVALLKPSIHETILEPSCGAGVFIIAILEYIIKQNNPSVSEMKSYVENKLFFSDIDQDAVMHAEQMIHEFLQDIFDLKDVKLNCSVRDALLNTTYYDCIIGNPPYIRTKNINKEYLKFLKQNFEFCKKGNIDIYYAFIELAHNFSTRTCMITPNSFITNNSASRLRFDIAPFITHLRDHKNSKQFETAATYTAIFVLNKDAGSDFKYAEIKNQFETFSRRKLHQHIWQLSSHHSLYNYSDRQTQFNEIADVHMGVATNSDKVYLVNKNSLNGKFYSTDYQGKEYLIEADICISMKKLSKLFGVNKVDDKMIIFPYLDLNSIIPEDILMELYPYAYNYLLAIREILDQRDKGKVDEYDAWYAYGRRQGFNVDFTGKTCFAIPVVYREDSFVYKKIILHERFVHTSGFVIIAKEGYEATVEAILNSKDFHIYLNLHGKSMPGKEMNYNRVTSSTIKKYPYLIEEDGMLFKCA